MPHLVSNLFRQVELWWLVFGLVAQTVFFLRFVAQWLASERRKKTVVPHAFWYLGLAGGLMLLLYAVHQRDPVFIMGQAGSVGMSLRNIFLIDRGIGKRLTLASGVTAIALSAVVLALPRGFRVQSHDSLVWMGFGFFAQSFFFLRFLVQWLASERVKRSVMPTSFWYSSLAGGVMLAFYAWHRQDPVYVLGQIAGVMIYLRNLVFTEGSRGKDLSFAAILVFLTFVLFAAKNDVPALWGSSEARAAEIAREMYVTGDYIMPHVNGRIVLTKPPLYHWLAALSYRFLDVDESSARLPSAVAGMLAVLMTYVLGRRMFGSVTGFLAAAITASSMSFVGSARGARTDMVFAFLIISAITAFYYAAQSERRSRLLYVLSFFFMGLAVMAKGPAGLFLPLVGGISYLYFTGGMARVKRIPWVAGMIVFLAVVLPWHVAAAIRSTGDQRSFYFWGQIARWATTQGGGGKVVMTSFFLYVPLLLVGFFPWSFFLPAGLITAVAGVRGGRARQLILPFVWFAAGLTAFSLSSTKAGRYMVPVLPAAALMVAYLWTQAWDWVHEQGQQGQAKALSGLRASIVPLAVTVAVIAAIVPVGPWAIDIISHRMTAKINTMDTFMLGVWRQFMVDNRASFIVWTSLAASLCIGSVVAVYKRKLALGFGCVMAAIVELLLLFQFSIIPKIDDVFAVKPFVAEVTRLADGGPVTWLKEPSLEAIFYSARVAKPVSAKKLKAFLDRDPKALVIAWESDLATLPQDTLDYARVVSMLRIKHQPTVILGSPARPGEADLPSAAGIVTEAMVDAAKHPRPSEDAESGEPAVDDLK